MLKRIPPKYRLAVWFAGLASFAGFGAWLAFVTPVPVIWPGVLIGIVLGVVAIVAFLSSLEHEPTARRRRRTP